MRQLPREQTGVIHSYILQGIILMGIVLAGFILLSKIGGQDTRHDRGQMSSSVILVQSAKLQLALSRALADGLIPSSVVGDLDLQTELVTNNILPRGLYPVPPEEALTATAVWQYAQRVYRVKDAAGGEIGSSAADNVLFIREVSAPVCANINFRLYGSSTAYSGSYAPGGGASTDTEIIGPTAVVPLSQRVGVMEGCVALDGSTTSYIYYKVTGGF